MTNKETNLSAKYAQPANQQRKTSEYAYEYAKKTVQERVTGKAIPTNLKASGEKFEGASDYQAQYTQHQMPERFKMAKREYVVNPNKFDGVSINKQDFQKFPTQTRVAGRAIPTNLKASGEKFEGGSDYQDQFKQHQMPERFKMPKREYVVNPNKFDGVSINKQDFQKFPTQTRVVGGAHKNNLSVNDDRFEGYSDYQDQFKQHQIPELFKAPKREYIPNPNKFDGVSINKQDFQKFPTQTRVVGGAHKNNLSVNDDKFEGGSDYQDQFKQHQMPERFKMEKREYVVNPNKFDGVSINKQDFKKFPTQTRVAGRAIPTNLKASGEKFEGASDYQDQFKQHTIPELFKAPKREYIPNPNKFDGISINKQDFQKFTTHTRVAGRAIPTNLKASGERFEGQSDYQSQFKQHAIPELFKAPKREYIPNPIKFDGVSINKKDFQNFPAQPRVVGHAHKNNLAVNDDKFEGGSDYQDQFKTHAMPERFKMAKREYVVNPNKFDGVSINKQDFQKFPTQTRVAGRAIPTNLKASGEKFEGYSDYQDQFKQHQMPERFKVCHKKFNRKVAKREFIINPNKFDGLSVAKSDYIQFPITKRFIGGAHKNNLQVGEHLIPEPETVQH